jgi:ribonuclease HI
LINIFTDGACKDNGKINNTGGWGYVIQDTESLKERHCCGHTANTTNNRMEMTAVIKVLSSIEARPYTEVTLHTDSNLIVKGMIEWIGKWKANGWKTAKRKPIENKELWLRIEELSANHSITWNHVAAHTGIHGNELADSLASEGARGHNIKRDFAKLSF